MINNLIDCFYAFLSADIGAIYIKNCCNFYNLQIVIRTNKYQ